MELSRGVEITQSFYDGKHATAKFVYKSFIARVFLPRVYVAVSIWNYVFVKGTSLPPNTVVHELRHALQWRELGFIGFLRVYLREHRRHGYRCNALEEDARIAAGEHMRCN
jgi:hypothetical protein